MMWPFSSRSHHGISRTLLPEQPNDPFWPPTDEIRRGLRVIERLPPAEAHVLMTVIRAARVLTYWPGIKAFIDRTEERQRT